MFRIKSRLAALCAAAVVTTGAAAVQAEVSVAAISGYFAQGFRTVSIVTGLDKAKEDFGVEVKLIDTGNRALDYEEQFNNVAKDGQYDLVFVMGWELVDALSQDGGGLSRPALRIHRRRARQRQDRLCRLLARRRAPSSPAPSPP